MGNAEEMFAGDSVEKRGGELLSSVKKMLYR